MAHVTLLQFSAAEMEPDQNAVLVGGDAACGKAVIQGRTVLSFDDTDEEAAITPTRQMPGQYAGGTLKMTVNGFFAAETTATDEAVFDCGVEAVTPADELDLSAGTSFDTLNTGNEIDPRPTAGWPVTFTDTLANKDSVAVADLTRFGIRRDSDAGADTCTGDFYVTDIEIWEDT